MRGGLGVVVPGEVNYRVGEGEYNNIVQEAYLSIIIRESLPLKHYGFSYRCKMSF